MNILDMRTIVFSYIISNIIITIILVPLWYQNRKRFRGISLWLIDYIMQVIGLTLVIMRGAIPLFVSAVVGNMIICTGMFIFYIGLERFVEKKSTQIHNYIWLAIFFFSMTYFCVVKPNLAIRNVLISFSVMVFAFQCILLILWRVDKKMRSIGRGVAIVFIIYFIISACRIAIIIMHHPFPNNDFFKIANIVDHIVMLTYQMLNVMLTFFLILMINSRLFMDINVYAKEKEKMALKLGENVKELENLNEELQYHSRELYKEKNKAQMYFNIAGSILVVIDSNQKVVHINQKGCELLGYDYQDIVGKNWFDNFIPEKIREDIRDIFNRLISGNIAGIEYTKNAILTNNNEERLIAWHNSLLKDESGEIIGTLSSGEDITDQERVEKEMKQLNEALKYRTDELELINKELETFSYTVSHDLQTPLSAIEGFGSILLEKYANKLDDEGNKYLQNILISSQRMRQLISDMLKLSKVTRTELNISKVNLSSIVNLFVYELRELDKERHVEFIITPDITVNADEQLIKIAMENLINNAWKYTKKQSKAKIEFGITEYENERVYFIRDNGIGFDMKYADRLFIPFKRLHSDKEFAGTGIGLATVQRIIHRHGGRIWAESKIGDGATFYFTL